jgi:penicillin-binding protein 2
MPEFFFSFRRNLNRLLRKSSTREIEPDEIFLDASNLPEFDQHQFEGRLEKPIKKRTLQILGASFLVIGVLFSMKIWSLQITQGDIYAQESEHNRLQHSLIFANRGVIYDRQGKEIAWNDVSEDDAFSHRVYSDLSGFAHLLGYISYPQQDASGAYYQEETIGTAGIEKLYDERLAGQNGLKIIETNALMEVRSESVIRLPENGRDMYLSIDAALQDKLYEGIASVAQANGFRAGAGVFLDVMTGEVLALTNFPEFSATIMAEGEQKETILAYQQDSRKPFLNRAVAGLYAPGSIIKPFVAAGVLNEGIIDPEKEILSTGSISVPNPYTPGQYSVFKDWKAHGWVDMRHALAVSSDVYFYTVGGGFEGQRGIGIAGIDSYLNLFGFGSTVGLFPGSEPTGTIPTPQWKAQTYEDGVWRIGDTYNTAIGQYGMQVTPLQAVRATAALANGGYLVTPHVLLNEKSSRISIDIPDEHLQVVREGMRLAVTEGTAASLNITAASVAGKTGTAQVGMNNQFMNSWIIGFFPYEQPRFAFAIVMEQAQSGTLYGAPAVMRGVLDWMSVNRPEYLTETAE